MCRQAILFERKRLQFGEAIKYTKVYQMGVVYHSGADDCIGCQKWPFCIFYGIFIENSHFQPHVAHEQGVVFDQTK